MPFELTPEVEVLRDEDGRVVQLTHTRQRYASSGPATAAPGTVAAVAADYVRDVIGTYEIEADQVSALDEAMPEGPVAESPRLRQIDEKHIIDTTSVVTFQQTMRGLPIWNANLSVVVAGGSPEVVSSTSTLHHDIDVGDQSLDRLTTFAAFQPSSLQEAIGIDDSIGQGFALNGSRLMVYRYDPAERLDPAATSAGPPANSEQDAPPGGLPDAGFDPAHPDGAPAGFVADDGAPLPPSDEPLQGRPPTLPLPPVPVEIVPGRHYVVREVLFRLTVEGDAELNWRAFVEPDTGAVLYLRALTAAATCAVFETDPIAKGGAMVTAASPVATLDSLRTRNLPMFNLGPVGAGSQALTGTTTAVQDIDAPVVAPPTTTSPFNFEYSSPTNDFAAASSYHHTDWMYRLVEGMGFNRSTYFDGTVFPVPVDHMGFGSSVNAQAPGNAAGNGIGRFRYGLMMAGQTMGIAAHLGVCLHEFGHALLWDHVNSPNFGWCHSAGDTLAMLAMDPTSKAPDRGATFPFVTAGTPGIDRRHDRRVTDGWAFGGTRDDHQYGTEQILSSLMFRVYRVTGGDDADVEVKRFAARYLSYLIIRAIGTLTATTTDPRVFVNALQTADDLTTVFEGHPGGAWHKVIRWGFEKQGLFQQPGAPTPVTQPGAPPAVDVFIDDGRNGEYEPYLTTIGSSPGVWNRLAADGGTANQQPVAGAVNHLYVRVGNRGLSAATGVSVKCYQGKPGTGLTWPGDWVPLTTASLPSADIPAGGATIVGPFAWTPVNSGPVSVLASASATGDASNADTVNGPLPIRRLVPNDNNLAQRDLVASGGTGVSLKIHSGSTAPGSTNWQPYGGNTGVFLDIDTSAAGFRTTPRYITALNGSSSHWATTGATSIYNATPTGFRVYVRWSDGSSLTPAQANSLRWHLHWLAVEG